jgi:hypothetical protein
LKENERGSLLIEVEKDENEENGLLFYSRPVIDELAMIYGATYPVASPESKESRDGEYANAPFASRWPLDELIRTDER